MRKERELAMIHRILRDPSPGRPIVSILACVAAVFLLMGHADAASVNVGGFTVERNYSYGSGYKVVVTQYDGSAGGVVELPQKAAFDGVEYDVQEIKNNAFEENEFLTSVTIPEGYQTIGIESFLGCPNLSSVTIPGSVTSISPNAFQGCPELETVTFQESTASALTLLNDVFADCVKLKTLALPSRLSSVNNNFAHGCNQLTRITVGEGCEKYFAEDDCLYEKNDASDAVTLIAYPFGKPDTQLAIASEANGLPVTAIGRMAFYENPLLEQVTVPASVTKFDVYCFRGGKSLMRLTLQCASLQEALSNAFTDLPQGSVIEVTSQEIADALEPSGDDLFPTYYYTPDSTAVRVLGGEDPTPVGGVHAAFSIDANPVLQDGRVQYRIYLDSASYVNTAVLKLSFDKEKLEEGSVSASEGVFSLSDCVWSTGEDKLVATIYLGITGNVAGHCTEVREQIATIALPVKDGAVGEFRMTMERAEIAGIPDPQGQSIGGTSELPAAAAVFTVADYDVNGDGSVDQIDLTQAQRYYQETSDARDWEAAGRADVNGDDVVDIDDLIEIFHQIVLTF